MRPLPIISVSFSPSFAPAETYSRDFVSLPEALNWLTRLRRKGASVIIHAVVAAV